MRGVQASTSACYMGRLGCDICITTSEQSYDININMLAITSIWISFWKKRIEEFVRSPRPSMKDAWHEKQTCRRSISLAREMQGEELWIKGGVGSPPPLIRFFPCENTLLKANCTLLLESSNLYIDIEISVVFGRDCSVQKCLELLRRKDAIYVCKLYRSRMSVKRLVLYSWYVHEFPWPKLLVVPFTVLQLYFLDLPFLKIRRPAPDREACLLLVHWRWWGSLQNGNLCIHTRLLRFTWSLSPPVRVVF